MHILRTGKLEIFIRSDLGGRIEDLKDLRTGKNWMWHPHLWEGRRSVLSLDAGFDENWTGGWEEVFPNDAAGTFEGERRYDHGELWSQPWRVGNSTEKEISLFYDCKSVPVDVEKTFSAVGEASFEIRYRFSNSSEKHLPYLFKLHPAFAIEEGDEFLMPQCVIEPVELGFSKIIGVAKRTPFPHAIGKQAQDVTIQTALPEESGLCEFVYASEFKEGWCGIRNRRTQSTLKISFDVKKTPYVWLFQSFGGFGGRYVAMLEPSTTIPWDLDIAKQRGTCAILSPKETQEYVFRVDVEKSN